MKNLDLISEALEEYIRGTELGSFYQRRAALHGKPYSKRKLFATRRGVNGDFTGWGIHFGGRSELQFNIGFEEDGRYFRYGVAFSLEKGPYFSDPVAILRSKIDAYNRLVSSNPGLLSGQVLWLHDRGGIHREPSMQTIPDGWVKEGNFIFIGERVNAQKNGVTAEQLRRAVKVMNQLLPLYEQIESSKPIISKVARVCWNSNLWQKPSGPRGKTKNKDTYEYQYGFGHEEWLFDLSKIIKGYKYGFIQALNHSHSAYEGKSLDLLLYAIEDRSKARYWVGKIKSISVLDKAEAKAAADSYTKNNWLKEMAQHLSGLELDASELSTKNPLLLFNCRFRPEDIVVFDPPIQFPVKDMPADYYGTLREVPLSQSILLREDVKASELQESNNTVLTSTRVNYESTKEIELVHKQWQKLLKQSLHEEFSPEEIKIELKGDKPVDVWLRINGKKIMIELKTANTARGAMKEAFGQLLDYSYRDPSALRPDVLIVVGPGVAFPEDDKFLEYIREKFALPLFYRQIKDGRIVNLENLLK